MLEGSSRAVRILGGLYVEIAILVFCAAILSETGKTKGPVFDTVGPDFLPTAVSYMVGALTLLQIVIQVTGGWRSKAQPQPFRMGRPVWTGLIFCAVTAVYVALLAHRVIPYAPATAVFIIFATLMLAERPTWRDAGLGAAIGLAMGFGSQYIFTTILGIDLPT